MWYVLINIPLFPGSVDTVAGRSGSDLKCITVAVSSLANSKIAALRTLLH